MRGFRGSRAAQNAMAFRSGQVQHHLAQRTSNQPMGPQGQAPHAVKAIPDWLKTPETRRMEQEALRASRAPQARAATTPAARPNLRLVASDGAAAPKKKTAAKKKAPAARIAATKRKAA